MSQEFFNPVRSVYGAGALSSLPKLLAGRKAVVVTFPEARRFGLVDRLQALLGDGLAGVIDAVLPNPDVAELRALYEAFWSDAQQAEVLVAVGGGSAIDTAKALMVGTRSGRFDDLVAALAAGGPFVPARVKTLIAVPTTAGTGSEVTPWATIWDREAQRKHSLHLPETWPSIAIVDPELMLSLPASVTLQSGLDALSHALESLWNVHRNPVSASLAVSAARSIVATLPELLARPDRPELRERLATAALQAGLAFSNTRTALAHSLSYDITLRHGVPHGIACSFSLPRIMQLAGGRDPALDALLLSVFDAHDIEQAVASLSAFLEGLGVSVDPLSYGIPEADWSERILQALAGARGRNFIAADAG